MYIKVFYHNMYFDVSFFSEQSEGNLVDKPLLTLIKLVLNGHDWAVLVFE